MTEAFKLFKSQALLLKKEDGINYANPGIEVVEQMANGYLTAREHGDEIAMDKYISGLMLRFWNSVSREKDQDEAVSQLYRALEYAFKYKAWLNPDKKVSAQQAIKQCIKTIKRQDVYDASLDKHRANFEGLSLDTPLDESTTDDNRVTTLGETLIDEDAVRQRERSESEAAAISLVQGYVDRKKLVEAIILDTIAFNDMDKVTRKTVVEKDSTGESKKYSQTYHEFWPYRCVQILSKLPSTYTLDFSKKYVCNLVELDKAFATIQQANNQKLYRFLRATLKEARSATCT